jgi:DNA polymerase II small subunit
MLEIVQRFAENGYQIDPDALEMILSHGGSRDRLIGQILCNIDNTIVVINAGLVSGILSGDQSVAGPANNFEVLPENQEIKLRTKDATGDVLDGVGVFNGAMSLPIGPEPSCVGIGIDVDSDITGNSTCVGEYEDFVRYFRDRYSRIREILSRRVNSRPIESLGKSMAGREISIIGMVMDIRTTAKGNRILELEDPTGMVAAIIQKDSEIYEQSGYIVPDEVIGITAISDGNGRVFVKSIMWPDMPNQSQPLEAGSGLIVLTSDLHVGSKYFMEDAWQRFVDWVNGEVDDPSGLASQVKYMVVAGDVVDGIGIYPGQESDLAIKDIYEQYELAGRYLSDIRRSVEIVVSPGNHDIVRQAEPQPALPASVQKFFSKDIHFVGDPAWLSIGGASVLVYHGRSIDDLVMRVPGLSYSEPEKAMLEMLRRRHLSPIYGGRVSIAPEHRDHYVINRPPSILHCGHVHTVGIARYKGVAAINSGTWQSQTEFQKKMNIKPTPAAVPIVDMATMRVRKLLFA